MKRVTSIILGVAIFYGIAAAITWLLLDTVADISDPAPDALHLIGFVALIPMVGIVGNRFAARKINYIKNTTYFKPSIVGIFLTTYLSFIPWVLTFFISDNRTIMYFDWSVVLLNIMLSFVMFALFLFAFLRE